MSEIDFLNYKIGIKQIDDEHLHLLDFSKRVTASIEDEEKTLQLVNFFHVLTIEHFKNEEQIMEKINYPYFDYHKKEHEKIAKSLLDLVNDKSIYNNLKQKSFLNKIRDVLIKHIDQFDMQIGEYAKNNNIEI